MKTLLVTGGSGQLGTAMQCVAGQSNAFQVVALNRRELDVTNEGSIHACFQKVRPDGVLNAAAFTAVDLAESQMAQATQVNATAAGLVASQCAAFDIPLVHISTDYVFDGRLGRPLTELDQTNPVCFYGYTKLLGEQFIREQNPRHVILRTSGIFSVTGHNFVKTMLELAKKRPYIDVVSDQYLNPTGAMSLARVIACIFGQVWSGSDVCLGTHHYAQSPACSWFEFAQTIFTIASRLDAGYSKVVVEPLSARHYPTLADRPADSRLDSSQLIPYLTDPRLQHRWLPELTEVIADVLSQA